MRSLKLGVKKENGEEQDEVGQRGDGETDG